MAKYLLKKGVQRKISVGGKIINKSIPVELSDKEAKELSADIVAVKETKKEDKKVKKVTKK